ncbi:hypothetical protein SAMN04487782_0520 [Stenotrophomonas maltophilia]|nr:hypothetical protein SAMN04487782_0520 [Stenotrophomonas maltophilia]
MQSKLLVFVAVVAMASCSSHGDPYLAQGRETTAARQCMDQCRDHYASCHSAGSSSGCLGSASQWGGNCEEIQDRDLRRSCQASMDFCRNRLPDIKCGEIRDRCLSACGGG